MDFLSLISIVISVIAIALSLYSSRETLGLISQARKDIEGATSSTEKLAALTTTISTVSEDISHSVGYLKDSIYDALYESKLPLTNMGEILAYSHKVLKECDPNTIRMANFSAHFGRVHLNNPVAAQGYVEALTKIDQRQEAVRLLEESDRSAALSVEETFELGVRRYRYSLLEMVEMSKGFRGVLLDLDAFETRFVESLSRGDAMSGTKITDTDVASVVELESQGRAELLNRLPHKSGSCELYTVSSMPIQFVFGRVKGAPTETYSSVMFFIGDVANNQASEFIPEGGIGVYTRQKRLVDIQRHIFRWAISVGTPFSASV